MKVEKEDVGYIALLTCILNSDPVFSADVIPKNIRKEKRRFEIDDDIKRFVGGIQFI